MRGNDESVALSVFGGNAENRVQFLSEWRSGYDVHIAQGLCPGMQKKDRSTTASASHEQGKKETRNKPRQVQFALVLILMLFTDVCVETRALTC